MIHETFQVGSDAEIDVHTHSGRVEVKTGPSGSITVEVETRDPGFIVEKRGDLIFVSSDKNSGWLSRGSAYVSIVVPDGTDVTIATASARTECHGDLGRVEIKTASGNVDVQRAAALTTKTASGTARIGEVSGDLRASSASGNIKVETCGGKSSFSSASGDVRVGDCRGAVKVSTASGDIRIQDFTGTSAEFKSMSGNVTVALHGGSKVDLDVTLLSGRLKLPKPEERQPAERHLSLRAKLVSGNLTIRKI